MKKYLAVVGLSMLSLSAVTVAGSDLYQEKYRPQFHYSPHQQWMNDPNGMVYFEGEYHLFYQYNPYSAIWGPMHWGHAVSKDLVNWEELPIALFPDNHGTIFSGSAVVDWNNSSGFGTRENPPLVAVYTYHDHLAENLKTTTFQTQGIAYSLDKGRSWKKYEGNPVLESPGIADFRDPKVTWYAPGEKWIMSLAVKDRISFYSSKNLKEWHFESDFGQGIGAHGGVWECPDLIRMKVDGQSEDKYVLLVSINPGGPNGGSGTQYFVGDFDGKTFTLDKTFTGQLENAGLKNAFGDTVKGVWLDYGTDNYAGVTWSDVPESDGRHLFIGWMNNWQYANKIPTDRWRGATTLPRELSLVRDTRGYRVISRPAKEVANLFSAPVSLGQTAVSKTLDLTKASGQKKVSAHTRLSLDPKQAKNLELTLANGKNKVSLVFDRSAGLIRLDRSASGDVGFDETFAKQQVAPFDVSGALLDIELFVDRSSVEIFIDQGRVVFTSQIFPDQPFDSLQLKTDSPVDLKSMAAHDMPSIWKKL